METAWERARERLQMSLAEVNDMVSDSGFTAESARLVTEGKANTNYHLTLGDGSSALLRVYQRDPHAGAREKAVLERVAELAPVPKVLFLDPGGAFSVTTWLEGSTIERLASEGRFEEATRASGDIGEALARVGTVAFDKPGFFDETLEVVRAWPSTLDGLLGHLEDCLASPVVAERAGSDTVGAVGDLVKAWRPVLEDSVGPPCLVHGDFKASNLLVKDGRLTGVLDWEFAHSGTCLLDVGQLFRHTGVLGDGFEGGFMAGFARGGGRLPDRWRDLAGVIDLVSLVDFLSRESFGPVGTEHVLRLVHGTIARLAT